MGYYAPQRGDYYGRGDPGFLSDVWKGVKNVAKAATGFVLGGGAIGQGVRAVGTAFAPTPPAFPGGAVVGPPAPAGFGGVAADGCCPRGKHLDKRTRTRCVSNRSMNITNPKALRRAMRRVQGFEKLAKRTIQFTSRTKMRKR